MSIAALAVPFVLALLPIIWLVVALIVLHLPAWKGRHRVLRYRLRIGAHLVGHVRHRGRYREHRGFRHALWPIVLVIIAAVFTYNLCVRTGPWT